MVKKIIITGGLGYIGTELCKIYSGVSWHHKILLLIIDLFQKELIKLETGIWNLFMEIFWIKIY